MGTADVQWHRHMHTGESDAGVNTETHTETHTEIPIPSRYLFAPSSTLTQHPPPSDAHKTSATAQATTWASHMRRCHHHTRHGMTLHLIPYPMLAPTAASGGRSLRQRRAARRGSTYSDHACSRGARKTELRGRSRCTCVVDPEVRAGRKHAALGLQRAPGALHASWWAEAAATPSGTQASTRSTRQTWPRRRGAQLRGVRGAMPCVVSERHAPGTTRT